MRNVKQNIHSPQRHKETISSCTQVCQVLLPVSSTPLVCTAHSHYLCSRKLDKVCFIQMKNYGCAKGNPSLKNQFREESCDTSFFTDTWEQVALGTGSSIN